jgi:D-amino-acid dehydrogenase
MQVVNSGKRPTIAVLGAGVVGVATALALAENGYAVTLVDQREYPGLGTSRRNAAQLSYAYVDAMGSPSMLKQSPSILLGLEKGIRFRLIPSIYNLNWLNQFILQCTEQRFLDNTQSALALAQSSRAKMAAWFERYGMSFNQSAIGKLQLVASQSALDAAEKLVSLKNQFGFDTKILGAESARALDPAVAQFKGELAGAIFTPSDAVGDPYLFCQQALEAFLKLSPENQFISGATIEGIAESNGQITEIATSKGKVVADGFVFALGVGTKKFSKMLGVKTPIVPVAGYSLTLDRGEVPPTHSITDAAGKFVVCPLGDKIRVAGFADIGVSRTAPPKDRIEMLKAQLFERFPHAAKSHGDDAAWIGHRPMTPNSQPIIAQTKLRNGFVNAGHGSFGWTLAAGSAEKIVGEINEFYGINSDANSEITSDNQPFRTDRNAVHVDALSA